MAQTFFAMLMIIIISILHRFLIFLSFYLNHDKLNKKIARFKKETEIMYKNLYRYCDKLFLFILQSYLRSRLHEL